MQQIYAIRDDLEENFGGLFCATNDAVALRQFRQLLSSDKSFHLCRFGVYNTDTGYIQLQDSPSEVNDVQQNPKE